MGRRLRVGVVGCGLVAQVMHLNYLRELSDQFQIAAICDLSPSVREAVGREYGVDKQFADWRELVAEPLDAAMVLTSGSHAPVAIAAAKAGMHVLVEKPMCFSVAEGNEMVAAANAAGVKLMVAYNKRYDPAYLRLAAEVPTLQDLRLLRITTLESPIAPYVQHYNLRRGGALDPDTALALAKDDDARIDAALGPVDELNRWAYRNIMLDTLVHEFNAMRGVMGEPDRLEFADIRRDGVTAVFRYGNAQCVLIWVDLPSIARYQMEFAFYSPDRRLTLSFPSPFLRSMPTLLISEAGEAPSPRSWRTEEITSYEESFKQELVHFHDCVTTGRDPITSGADTLHDLALCDALIRVHESRVPRDRPSEPAMIASA